ncbi:MAG: 2,3-bisphosphoglycerate-dependent phosphoglycerate mutase [Deltaproteobacteria bacterium]|nr:2,3-bisphosphoglycerate-dependent phosphoglycerate mutase [Deltaproteobacteria bacterium]
MASLILLRHGQSLWNASRRYTGWADIGLSPQGREEARRAGRLLAAQGPPVDAAYSSCLVRARETLALALAGQDPAWAGEPQAVWRLNERHCGVLEGLGKEQAARLFGYAPLAAFSHDLAAKPPDLAATDPRHPRFADLYRAVDPALLPAGESIAEVIARVAPWVTAELSPALAAGHNVLLAGHGICLWAVLYQVGQEAGRELPRFSLPNASPLCLELTADLTPLRLNFLAGAPAGALPEVF